MNNLPSYCGLVDPKKRASDKDLPLCSRFVSFHLRIKVDVATLKVIKRPTSLKRLAGVA